MIAPLTAAALAEIRARAEKATPGPWEPGGVVSEVAQTFDSEVNIYPPDTFESHGFQYGGPVAVVHACAEGDDWPFIAHARTDIPALLDEVERCRGILARVTYVLESAQTIYIGLHGEEGDTGDRIMGKTIANARGYLEHPESWEPIKVEPPPTE